MSGADAQDKSFDPTPARLERARREGDAPLSRDAAGAGAWIGLFVAVAAGAGAATPQIAGILAAFLERPEDFTLPGLAGAALAVAAPAAVFFAAPAAGAVAALALQQNVVVALPRLKPKLSRLSPIANAKHKFGSEGVADFVKASLLLALLATGFLALYQGRFAALPGASMSAGESVGALIAVEAVLLIGAVTLFAMIVGAIDLVLVRRRHRKRLMMSLEEVRREAKETDGDPHFKSVRRERAKALATNRMLADIPKASVVVVNPEHYAVALRWAGPKSGPPVCVAKGVDRMADKIRELAALHGVPIRRDPPTARAIFSVVEVGEEIRREHYAPIAAAIHFAEQVRRKARPR